MSQKIAHASQLLVTGFVLTSGGAGPRDARPRFSARVAETGAAGSRRRVARPRGASVERIARGPARI